MLKLISKILKKIFISDTAIKHSSLGDFIVNPRTGKISKFKSGGHGEENIKFLKKNNIDFDISYEYNNGVRVGNVPGHKEKKKRSDNNQIWFPKSWTRKTIKNAGKKVLQKNSNIPDGKQAISMYRNVKVGIRKTNGQVATIYPTKDQKGGIKK